MRISHWLGQALRISFFLRKQEVVSGTAVNYVGAPDNRINVAVGRVLTPQGKDMILVLGPEVGCRSP